MKCRFCNNELSIIFIDLANSPPSNSYLTKEQLNEPEIFYPLKIFLCDNCFLVQIDEYKKSSEIFSDEEEKLFSSHCKSLPPLELDLGGGETESVSQSPDVAVTKLVNHFLAVKDAKKFLKKVTVFCKSSTDIFGYKIDPCQLTDGLRRKILAQYPSAEGAVILNDLPFEEVVERLEAAA